VKHWTHEPVPCKSQFRGWIAGKPFGGWQHFLKKHSVVCREKMSEKALRCEHCEAGLIPDWRGFVPWYSAEYVPMFSLITYAYHESVCEIDHLAQIVLRRGPLKTDAIVIRAETWRATPLPYSADRFAPVELNDFCVKVLWKDAALIQWDKMQQPTIPGVVHPEQAALDFADPGCQKLARLAKAERKHKEEVVKAEDSIGKVMNRLLKPAPTANGKYHAPPG
jgi:hypothetical protein